MVAERGLWKSKSNPRLNKKFDNQEINSYVSEQICKV